MFTWRQIFCKYVQGKLFKMFGGDLEQSTAKVLLSMLNDICDGFDKCCSLIKRVMYSI